jgi:predicted O-linked N-acetylglucosamine transferase (SPINDLY family)
MRPPADGFVFCCFNAPYKILPDLFDVWMRVLRTVERSVLWLAPGNATACANLRLEAGRRGIGVDRLVFAPRVPPPDHLARHVHADLFLDTAPYNAGTTANDALFKAAGADLHGIDDGAASPRASSTRSASPIL